VPVHAEGVLGLVEHALGAGAVDVAVVGAAELVGKFLASRLLVVRLGATSELVASIGERLLHLGLGGLGGVGNHGLLDLVVEVFAAGVRHVDGLVWGWW